jgi:hypothetical protein
VDQRIQARWAETFAILGIVVLAAIILVLTVLKPKYVNKIAD